ncbi:hypothetical protein RSAG8_13490, partial [Rhizoctonia solani AG-8 WAC10335]
MPAEIKKKCFCCGQELSARSRLEHRKAYAKSLADAAAAAAAAASVDIDSDMELEFEPEPEPHLRLRLRPAPTYWPYALCDASNPLAVVNTDRPIGEIEAVAKDVSMHDSRPFTPPPTPPFCEYNAPEIHMHKDYVSTHPLQSKTGPTSNIYPSRTPTLTTSTLTTPVTIEDWPDLEYLSESDSHSDDEHSDDELELNAPDPPSRRSLPLGFIPTFCVKLTTISELELGDIEDTNEWIDMYQRLITTRDRTILQFLATRLRTHFSRQTYDDLRLGALNSSLGAVFGFFRIWKRAHTTAAWIPAFALQENTATSPPVLTASSRGSIQLVPPVVASVIPL